VGNWQHRRSAQIFSLQLAEWKRLTEQAMETVRTRGTGTLQCDIPVLVVIAARSQSGGLASTGMAWLRAEILQRGRKRDCNAR
jgi:hypothetical protein